MDKMREEFEYWAISDMGYMVTRAGDGYKCDYMNTAWLSWKASRASLCVELPCGYIGHPYRFDILSAIDDCRLALEDAGVEYK